MKIQRFSGIQKEFDFFPEENHERFKNRFYCSDLGKLYKAVPWKDLIKNFEIKEKVIGRLFNLRKIKARTKVNEILWIFFGIHTSNALVIGRKMLEQKQIAV